MFFSPTSLSPGLVGQEYKNAQNDCGPEGPPYASEYEIVEMV